MQIYMYSCKCVYIKWTCIQQLKRKDRISIITIVTSQISNFIWNGWCITLETPWTKTPCAYYKYHEKCDKFGHSIIKNYMQKYVYWLAQRLKNTFYKTER